MTGAGTRTVRSCRFGELIVGFDDRVLAPRPWTLMQSRWGAELCADLPDGPILELCAGAGHIGQAATLLTGRPLVQVDIDGTAVDFARANAIRNDLADRVDVRHGEMDTVLAPAEWFPIVIADPPYLPSAQVASWPEDPVRAIDGGADGLRLVRTCLQVAAAHLTDDGVVLLQVAGDAQADDVLALVHATPALGLVPIGIRRHDADRAVMALRRSARCSGRS